MSRTPLPSRAPGKPNHSTPAKPAPARRRHVCIVTETYPPELNGVALTVKHWAEGLRSQGHVVSLVRPRQGAFDSVANGDFRLTLVRGLPLPGYKSLRFGLPAGRILRRNWMDQPPNVIYVATEGPLGWSALRAARRLGIPVFSGFHTNFHRYSGHYRLGWLRPVIFRYLWNFHRRTAATVVPSADLQSALQNAGLTNVSVIGRGVDSRLFHPRRRSAKLRQLWGAADADPVLLYVGRVAGEKNLHLAVEAYRAVKQAGAAARFVIVGDGPLRAALQAAHPELIFCGVRTGKDLAAHYASADIFLFPSETETFGNVTLEAMASGLAVVAYDYAAARTHIVDGKTGVLVPFGDARAFIERAVELTAAPERAARIRRRARQQALSLEWDRVVERFAALLMKALDNDDAESGLIAGESLDTAWVGT